MSSDDYIIINCPHCEDSLIIYKKELRCRVFRHGVYINNNKPINPHMPKNKCELLVKEKKIFGCGKPFRINKDKAEICGYI